MNFADNESHVPHVQVSVSNILKRIHDVPSHFVLKTLCNISIALFIVAPELDTVRPVLDIIKAALRCMFV